MAGNNKDQPGKRVSREDGGNGGKARRRVLIAAGIVVCLVLAVVGIGYGIFHHYYSMLDRPDPNATEDPVWSEPVADETDPPDASAPPPATSEEIDKIEEELRQNLEQMETNSELYRTDAFNILLIGVDSRENSFSGRSDSMILFSINKATKKITMTSFLRDIYVSIPGYQSNRLNAAHAFGGTKLLTETIKANFGIQVDRCVTINFYLVMDAVDAVGGIDLELTAAELKVMNNYIRDHNRLLGNPAETDVMPEADGTYHVNGNQALAYARVRYVGSDFARTGRQRTVIMKCLEKLKGEGLGELNRLAERFLPRVRTDLTEGDCASLLLMMLGISDYEFRSMAIPVDGTWQSASIRGMSVLTIDFEANTKAWHHLVDGDSAE